MTSELSKRLKQALSLRNMKPVELSEKTGISLPLISNYMSGNYSPRQNNIYKICKVLDINEAWLMGYDVSISRVPEVMRNEENKQIIAKLEKLTAEQKEIVIKMIDNMK